MPSLEEMMELAKPHIHDDWCDFPERKWDCSCTERRSLLQNYLKLTEMSSMLLDFVEKFDISIDVCYADSSWIEIRTAMQEVEEAREKIEGAKL